jgi:hypothetical protein
MEQGGNVEVDLDRMSYVQLESLLQGLDEAEDRRPVVDAIIRRLVAKGVLTVEHRNGQRSFGPGLLTQPGFDLEQIVAAMLTETQ